MKPFLILRILKISKGDNIIENGTAFLLKCEFKKHLNLP